MATEAWIDSATREQRPALASDTELTGYHVLTMARADAEYEAAERDRARRCVLRLAGDDAGDMLDALGLPPLADDERRARAAEGEQWPIRPSPREPVIPPVPAEQAAANLAALAAAIEA